MDVLVAEHVFGWYVDGRELCRRDKKPGDVFLGDVCEEIPAFSTDIAAAWQVVERLMDGNLGCYLDSEFLPCPKLVYDRRGFWACSLCWTHCYAVAAEGETAPLAICRCALLCVLQ